MITPVMGMVQLSPKIRQQQPHTHSRFVSDLACMGEHMSTFTGAALALTDPDAADQLRAFDQALAHFAHHEQADVRAGFAVLERFAEHDGFGVFWTLLHALEASATCFTELRASVQRQPCAFNVLMLHRQLNSGVQAMDGAALLDLLRAVAAHPLATVQARADAARFVSLHERRHSGAS